MNKIDRMDIALKYIYDNGNVLLKSKGMWIPVYDTIEQRTGTKVTYNERGNIRCDVNKKAVSMGLVSKVNLSGQSGWQLTRKGVNRVEKLLTESERNTTRRVVNKNNLQPKEVATMTEEQYSLITTGSRLEQLVMFMLGVDIFVLSFVLTKLLL